MSTSGGPIGDSVKASTPAAGFALQNGTPVIITWTAPNDGKLHPVLVVAALDVTVAETGGAVGVTVAAGAGLGVTNPIFAGGKGIGNYQGADSGVPDTNLVLGPGQTVTVAQTSALTLGAATVFAQIIAS